MNETHRSKQAKESVVDHALPKRVSDQQLYGSSHKGKRYVKIEYNSLNSYQNFLYNRALFGLAVYNQEEISQMNPKKRKRIIKVHKRAQEVLNLWKQKIVNTLSAKFFMTIFPKTECTKYLVEHVDDVDPTYVNKMSFKELHMSKDIIIKILIEEGVLPKNFYQLKTEPHAV